MLGVGIGLVAVAVLLAWPVPVAVARAQWPARAPGRALALWQAIAVAGGLAMVAAPLALATAGLGPQPADALTRLLGALTTGGVVVVPIASMAWVLVATVVAGYLLGTLAATVGRVGAQRRRHRALLALLSEPYPDLARTRLIDDAAPVAYCLPRGFGSLTVLSRGLVDRLGPDELAAVIAHEHAHVSQRHSVVLVAFRAWHAALPGFPVARLAEERVAVLIEMLADDRARREAGDAALARAIVKVAEGPHPVGGDSRGTDPARDAAGALAERLRRLTAAGSRPDLT